MVTGSNNSGQTTDKVRAEVEQINRENTNIVVNLRELEKQESQIYGRKKEYIQQLAENYARLHELGEYKLPLDHICATICSRMTDEGMFATEAYARKVLHAKYKQADFINDLPPTTTATDSPTETYWANASAKYDYQTNEVSSKPTYNQTKAIDEMNRDELREVTEERLKAEKLLKDQLRGLQHGNEMYLDKCARNNIALDPEIFKVKEPSETTLVTESGVSALYNALDYYGNLILKAKEKVYKFKPNDADARKWAKAVMTMAELWKPWADEKYRKDSISWMLVQMDNIAHGKHAAATMHSTLTPDGIKRALTREQVGDKYEMVIQQCIRFNTAYVDMIAMHRHHMEYAERNIADRAVRMKPKLSERS